jgi:hypothetical protein
MPRGGRREGAGRPVGSISKTTAEIKALAQKHGPQAIARLAELSGLISGRPGADSEAAQIAALRELLDRGYGKATQPLSGDATGAPIAYSFRWADALPHEPEPIAEADDTNDVGDTDRHDLGDVLKA